MGIKANMFTAAAITQIGAELPGRVVKMELL